MADDDRPIIGYSPNGLPITAGPTPKTATPEKQRELIEGRARHQAAKAAQQARRALARASKKSRPKLPKGQPVQELTADELIEASRAKRESWNGFADGHEDLLDVLTDEQVDALRSRWTEWYSGQLPHAVFRAEVLCLKHDFGLVKVRETLEESQRKAYEDKRRHMRLFGGRSGTSDGF